MRLHKWIVNLIVVLIFCVSCKEELTIPLDKTENQPSSYEQYGTPFNDLPKVQDIVMYEINLRAFSSTGDLQGVINRLDELKQLNINVIWLMPIHPIGEVNSVNSPYSVKNYKEVSSEYGTLEDLRTLTDEAHTRGMAVIMDWVANHTAWDNPWITNKDWYTQDGSGNIIHPPGTNWQDVADLNYNNSDMRLAMVDAMKYWILEANIDGYRCDYADGIPSSFWQQAFDTLSNIPERDYILLAEGSRADHFTSGFDMTYSWNFYSKLIDVFNGQAASGLYLTHESEYNNIPEGKQKLRYSTNHDQSAWEATPMVLFDGKEGALVASVATIFMGGVPLFYTGQEVGREATLPFFSNSPINWEDNPDMLLEYQQLMNFYSQSEVAKSGIITDHSNADIICFSKTLNNEEILIIGNTRSTQVEFLLPEEIQNTFWTNAINSTPVELGTSFPVGCHQYLILEK